jgi:hypothetical protein
MSDPGQQHRPGLALPWGDVVVAAPTLAASVQRRFLAHAHHVLATVRPDGRPRVNGTNVFFTDGLLWFGTLVSARRVHDLQSNPHVAIHSAPLDDNLPAGGGDARIEGVVRRLSTDDATRLFPVGPEVAPRVDGAYFEVQVSAMSLVEVDGDELVVTWWRPGADVTVTRRR